MSIRWLSRKSISAPCRRLAGTTWASRHANKLRAPPKVFSALCPRFSGTARPSHHANKLRGPPKVFSAPCPGFWGTTRASHHVNKLWGHRKVFAAHSPQVFFCSLSPFLRNPQQPFGAATVQTNFEAAPKFFLLPIPVSQDPLGPAIMQIHFWPPKVFLLLVPVSQEPLGPATMPLTLWARLKNGGRSARKTRKRHSRRGEVDKLQILIWRGEVQNLIWRGIPI